MKLTIDPCGTLDIEASNIYLRGGYPVMNSMILKDIQMEIVLQEPDHQILQYRSSALGNGMFGLEIHHHLPSPLTPPYGALRSLPLGEGLAMKALESILYD